MNADCDGQAGLQELAGAATLLFYQTEEGRKVGMLMLKKDHRILGSLFAIPD